MVEFEGVHLGAQVHINGTLREARGNLARASRAFDTTERVLRYNLASLRSG